MRRFRNFSLILLAVTYSFSSQTVYSEVISKEDKIKASYVFNFIRFIRWPSDKLQNNKQPINVCAFNRSDDFIRAFRPVIGKKVNGHPLVLHKISDLNNMNSCHLVYIDKSEKKNINVVLEKVKNNKILSISDIKTFCKQGGMIGMVKKKGKIQVEINLEVARNAGFHISSNLLEVANIVTSQ